MPYFFNSYILPYKTIFVFINEKIYFSRSFNYEFAAKIQRSFLIKNGMTYVFPGRFSVG